MNVEMLYLLMIFTVEYKINETTKKKTKQKTNKIFNDSEKKWNYVFFFPFELWWQTPPNELLKQ